MHFVSSRSSLYFSLYRFRPVFRPTLLPATATMSTLAAAQPDSPRLSVPAPSTTSIKPGTEAGYVAPPIPSSFKASVAAWWKAKPIQDAAQAELHLYRHVGYFENASVNNVVCEDDEFRDGKGLARGLNMLRAQQQEASNSTVSLANPKSGMPWFLSWPFRRDRVPQTMTMGQTVAEDGKVGCIRLVDLGSSSVVQLSDLGDSAVQPSNNVAANDDSDLPPLTASHILNDNLTKDASDTVPRCTPPSGRKLNMLEIGVAYTAEKEAEIKQETKIVLLHGYGAGTAFFFQNLNALAQIPNSRLYALDWLGMGRSSRPGFHVAASQTKTVETRVAAAESFFVDSLEQWRQKAGLEKMVLVGHSLGGYLSLAYALRHPQRVERLVLVSPVGIPEEPPSPVTTPDSKTAVEREVTETQNELTGGDGNASSDGAAPSNSNAASSSEIDAQHKAPRFSNRTRSIFAFLWEQNISPFGILRTSMFFGPMLAGKYTTRRFGSLPAEELRSLHAYCQSIFLDKGSGEYCLAHLLAPGAFARMPMVNRISDLKMPMTFLYGDHDWMDINGGYEAVKRLRNKGNTKTNCFSLPKSGHHLYLDNPIEFDALVSKILKGQADDMLR